MHLKVFLKLKKTQKTLSSGQIYEKKPKNQKKTKKTHWAGFFFEPGFFQPCEQAHVSYPVSRLGPRANPQTREGLAVSIKNKYNLSPSSGSCVRCGIERALEALQTAGSIQVHSITKMKKFVCLCIQHPLLSVNVLQETKQYWFHDVHSISKGHILRLTHGLDKLTIRT